MSKTIQERYGEGDARIQYTIANTNVSTSGLAITIWFTPTFGATAGTAVNVTSGSATGAAAGTAFTVTADISSLDPGIYEVEVFADKGGSSQMTLIPNDRTGAPWYVEIRDTKAIA